MFRVDVPGTVYRLDERCNNDVRDAVHTTHSECGAHLPEEQQ